jgi:hypothetical protein
VDFTLTDEQELLRDTARSMLTEQCPRSLVRAHAENPEVIEPLFDRHLREWLVLGQGPVVDLCLFQEEAGAALLPGTFFPTAALFLPLLDAVGHPLAPRVAAGQETGTVAVAGRSGVWEVTQDPVRTFVPEADGVDHVAIVVPGPGVAVVQAASLERRRVRTLDTTRRTYEIDVPKDLEPLALDEDVLGDVLERATVALAAELVGVSRWLVESTVAYSKEREQFDRPIGSFQGLQFRMVDTSLDHERAAAAVYYAAMAVDADNPDRHRAVHVAKAAAGTAARGSGRAGMQIHGGIGYTWEHDLHLYLRRAYASDDLLGDAAWHHDRLASLLFD